MEKVSADEFNQELQNKMNMIKNNLPKAISACCEKVRSTALNDMAKTQRNMNVSYGKRNHHPSLPGNPPAPDTGNLRYSIHHTIVKENNACIGIVGTDVEYGKILEYGSSRVAPRPWLKPSLDKNENFIKSTISNVIQRGSK